ncbi:VOC family protein [bacterium]|nr:VOC family protein [bacterium]
MGIELKPLGWLHYCLNVVDIEKSCDFYEKIGFVQVDGERSQGWAVMHNATTELALYSGHGEEGATTLNFRGANIDELAERVRSAGIAFLTEPKTNGQGSGSFMLDDPAGNRLFMDTAPDELERFLAGNRLGVGDSDGSLAEGQPLIGVMSVCCFVDNLQDCIDWWVGLGMPLSLDMRQYGFVVLSDGWCKIALMSTDHQGSWPKQIINFRGGDVQAIADRLKAAGLELSYDARHESDDSWGTELKDPDGYVSYFNTGADERLY